MYTDAVGQWLFERLRQHTTPGRYTLVCITQFKWVTDDGVFDVSSMAYDGDDRTLVRIRSPPPPLYTQIRLTRRFCTRAAP